MAKGLFQGQLYEFLWNVDSHVGPGCPNKTDDVQLVQAGMVAAGKTATDPADKAVMGAVQLGATYTGGAADPLTIAIKHMQKRRGGVQDGKVSPMNYAATLDQSIGIWMLTALMLHLRKDMGANWPRLEKLSGCPPALAAASAKIFAHKNL